MIEPSSHENLSPQVLAALARQVKLIATKPPEGVKYIPCDGTLTEVMAEIVGPEGTPYEGGVFRLKLIMGREYPTTPPRGVFLTKIFHPNVSPAGDICVNTLKRDWCVSSGRVRVAELLAACPSSCCVPAALSWRGGGFLVAVVCVGCCTVSVCVRGVTCVCVFVDCVRPSAWLCRKPDVGLSHVLAVIRCLLIVPFPESSLNDDAGKMFMESYDEYARYARLMTRYAHRPHRTRFRQRGELRVNADVVACIDLWHSIHAAPIAPAPSSAAGAASGAASATASAAAAPTSGAAVASGAGDGTAVDASSDGAVAGGAVAAAGDAAATEESRRDADASADKKRKTDAKKKNLKRL
jgi:ubiquitin-protein ligase